MDIEPSMEEYGAKRQPELLDERKARMLALVGAFIVQHEKSFVNVSERLDGAISVKVIPKDFEANGPAEVDLNRVRNDDGSVEITILPGA